MKRILALLLALVMLLTLAACGKDEESTPTGESTGATTNTTESTNDPTDGTQDSTQGTTEGTTGGETTETTEPPTTTPPTTTPPTTTPPTTTPPTTTPPTTTPPTTTPPTTEAPHTHSYSSKVTTAATCGKDGVKTFTCSCGDSYTEKIAATGQHSWGNWKTEAQALVGKDGTEKRTCSTCSTSESRKSTKDALTNSFLCDYNLGWFMGDWPVNDGLGSYYGETPANKEGIQGGTILNYLGADYNESDRTDMDFTISFANAVAYLSTKFNMTDSLKAEMKADRRYDSATDSFNLTYPGTTPIDIDKVEGYVHNGGNKYTVYYKVSARHGSTPTYWKAEIEYNLLNGNSNKCLSLVGVESLPSNLTK